MWAASYGPAQINKICIYILFYNELPEWKQKHINEEIQKETKKEKIASDRTTETTLLKAQYDDIENSLSKSSYLA